MKKIENKNCVLNHEIQIYLLACLFLRDFTFVTWNCLENVGIFFMSFLSWPIKPFLEIQNRLQRPHLNSYNIVTNQHSGNIEANISPHETKVSPSVIPFDIVFSHNLILNSVWAILTVFGGSWIYQITGIIVHIGR